MKKYKALVSQNWSGKIERCYITGEYETKKAFLTDIYGNGYTCSSYLVKEENVWNWIIDELQYYCEPEDFYALKHFTKIPKDNEEYKQMLKKYREAYWNNWTNQYVYREMHKSDKAKGNNLTDMDETSEIDDREIKGLSIQDYLNLIGFTFKALRELTNVNNSDLNVEYTSDYDGENLTKSIQVGNKRLELKFTYKGLFKYDLRMTHLTAKDEESGFIKDKSCLTYVLIDKVYSDINNIDKESFKNNLINQLNEFKRMLGC